MSSPNVICVNGFFHSFVCATMLMILFLLIATSLGRFNADPFPTLNLTIKGSGFLDGVRNESDYLTAVFESLIFNGSYTLYRHGGTGKKNAFYQSLLQLKRNRNNKKLHSSTECNVGLQFHHSRANGKVNVICGNDSCFSSMVNLFNLSGVYLGLIKFSPCYPQHSVVYDPTFTKSRVRRSAALVGHGDVKYIELYIVYDNDLYVASGRKIENCVAKVSEIVNALDTIYRAVNVRVVLVGLEVWTEGNKINITTSGELTLERFTVYTEKIKNADNIQLLTAQRFDNILGIAYVGTMCSKLHSSGASTYSGQYNKKFISTLAHEIGHNLNLSHDAINSCSCADATGKCVMYYKSIPNATPKKFSECSIESLNKFLKSELSSCLVNQPSQSSVSAQCGNNIVESGEECDCGNAYFSSDNCCDCPNCKFKANSIQCSSGFCCYQCQLLSNKTICRPSVGECDLTDYCDGSTSECNDTFVANGERCSSNGVCIDGKCVSRELQCKFLWGSTANHGRDGCYEKLNKLGRSYGHCGFLNEREGTYSPCDVDDVFCGKLQCSNVSNKFPVVGSSSGFSKVQFEQNGEHFTCHSGHAELGRNQTNPGMVADWTPCNEGKYCLRNKCTTYTFPSNCQFPCKPNGICTNHATCHCKTNWTGPSCNIRYLRTDNIKAPISSISSDSVRLFSSIVWMISIVSVLSC